MHEVVKAAVTLEDLADAVDVGGVAANEAKVGIEAPGAGGAVDRQAVAVACAQVGRGLQVGGVVQAVVAGQAEAVQALEADVEAAAVAAASLVIKSGKRRDDKAPYHHVRRNADQARRGALR